MADRSLRLLPLDDSSRLLPRSLLYLSQDLTGSVWEEERNIVRCSLRRSLLLPLSSLLSAPPASLPVSLLPHPVPGEATLLMKRGGFSVRLPGVSGRLPGFLPVPIPAAFRSSTRQRLRWLSRRLLSLQAPVSPSSYSRCRSPEGKEAVF
ncbi:hypothetical protein NDU88_005181 [Pleurodeles waltl]|uniref:Uncharacterized protein n=1 Tax=Pleurodeles waltl TaxID=8319 RepID=A0AAV7UHC4_PLEWA|nr:hypothetical protein NDU88_005181 [Pleurodeles waltl]